MLRILVPSYPCNSLFKIPRNLQSGLGGRTDPVSLPKIPNKLNPAITL